ARSRSSPCLAWPAASRTRATMATAWAASGDWTTSETTVSNADMRGLVPDIEAVSEIARAALAAKNTAREAGLSLSRDALRNAANAIRAVHRGEFALAEELAGKSGALLAEAKAALKDHPDVRYAGFVQDAEKEYAEARLTLAFIAGHDALPRPADLDVDIPAYLNGLGEAVGELRRYLLDRLRLGEIERCEQVLTVMDEVY